MNKNVNMCNGWYGLEDIGILHALDFNGIADLPSREFCGIALPSKRPPAGSDIAANDSHSCAVGARYYTASRPELSPTDKVIPYAGVGERLARDPVGSLFRLFVHNAVYSFALNGLFVYFVLRPLVEGVVVPKENLKKI